MRVYDNVCIVAKVTSDKIERKTVMKKDLIFAPIMIIIAAMLFLFDVTGKPAHIAIAIVGVLVLAVYTSATKKEWKIPALEIVTRLFYGLALISGIVVANVDNIVALNIAHKVSAALFVGLLVVLLVLKFIDEKKKK